MSDINLTRELGRAVFNNDLDAVRGFAVRYPEVVAGDVDYLLKIAAGNDNVDMMALLVELGADIDAPQPDGSPEGAIEDAAIKGAVEAVRWLLKRGAKINHEVDGESRCMPLSCAVVDGHLSVVKVLVEHGADFHCVWNGNNALSLAVQYDKEEVADYLRSQGASLPPERAEGAHDESENPVLDHIKEHLGEPGPLSLQEIASDQLPITIHVVPSEQYLTLVTDGMSAEAMVVPAGAERFQYAELMMYLPPDWPLDDNALKDPKYSWPLTWMRRIARYPHDNETWLGGPATILANDEPPKPLAPITRLSCLLAIVDPGDVGRATLSDGTEILFYSLYPLYTEERDLEKRQGMGELLSRFQQHKVGRVVNLNRPNVAAVR